jgi:hypothetical protein
MATFNIKDLVSIKGANPYWSNLQKDVEILGYTKLSQLSEFGVDFYKLYFVSLLPF